MRRFFLFLIPVLIGFAAFTIRPVYADGSWEPVGSGPVSGPNDSTSDVRIYESLPKIALAPDGTVYAVWSHGIAWTDSGGAARATSTLYVKRFNGMNWEEVGDGSASGNGLLAVDNPPQNPMLDWVTHSPTIAIAPDGVPYVAWVGGYNGSALWYIYMRRFNGSQWEEVCGSSATGTGIAAGMSEKLDMAIHTDGTIYLTWIGIQVRRCSGTTWEDMHFVDPNNYTSSRGDGRDPSIALASDGTPYIAYEIGYQTPSSGRLYVKRWNGAAWEVVGNETQPGFGIGYDELNDSNGPRTHPSLAIDSIGTPYIAWEQNVSPRNRIYVRHLVNGIWEEVGVDSALHNTGISASPDSFCDRSASWPQLILASGDIPYVAWIASDGATSRIYLKRFRNDVWEEVLPGSACGEGLNINDAPAGSFSMASNGHLQDPVYAVWSGVVNILPPPDVNAERSVQASAAAQANEAPQSVFAARFAPPAVSIPPRNYFTTSSPTLTWGIVSWATGYQIQIASDKLFHSIEDDHQLDGTQLTYQPRPLRRGTYYWRVRARQGTGVWANTWGFTDTFVIDKPS